MRETRIDTKQLPPKAGFSQGKIRILIEGDCGVYYKNVDESFRIVDKLDPDKYEIWYMSYNAKLPRRITGWINFAPGSPMKR